MPRILKYLAFGLGGLLALLLIAVAIIAATFDPNAYKPQIIKLVQEKKQRTLAIPGDIKLTFFPKIGADLGKLSISEHKSPTVFASVESARISLALLPLLRKEVVVDKIKIDGLTANLKRYKDGKTNVDDLLSKEKEEEPSQAVKLDIDGVSITNTNVFFDDQMAGRKLELTKVNLNTGKIANGAPSDFKLTADVKSNNPQLATQIDIKSGFTLNLEQAHYVLKGLDAQVKGQAAGFSDLVVKLEGDVDLKPNAKQITLDDLKLSANGKQGPTTMEAKFAVPTLAVTDQKVKAGKIAGQAKLSDAGKTIDANFSVPSFDGTPQAFTIPSLGLDAVIKQGELNATAKLTGAINGDLDKQIFTSREIRLDLDGKKGRTAIKGVLTTPFTANMNAQIIELAKIVADFALPNPAGGVMAFKAGGNLNANLAKQTLAAHLNGKLDQSTIDAKFGLAKFTPPAYNFDISIDQIDVDRYTEKKPDAGGATGKPAQATPAAEQPIDLSALKDLNANGSVKIGSLKAANIRASNVRIDIRAAGGKLEVSPLSANLYQGSLAGAVTVAATNPPRFAVRQNLTGVSIGPLLKDAIGKEPIEGRGSIQLDVTTQGAVVSAMKKALDG
ncbi:MAG TPA: AsmA family protein, partial [Burkholderiales bacterium]|nr:AsmA family protein [Burkholderiales bacterium]